MHRALRLAILAPLVAGALSPCVTVPVPPIWTKHPASDTPLFRVVIDGKAGYINREGRMVIQPRFSPFYRVPGHEDFFGGYARVFLKDRTDSVLIRADGMIDPPVSQLGLDSLGNPSQVAEGMKAFAAESGQTIHRFGHARGFQDGRGNIVIAPQSLLSKINV